MADNCLQRDANGGKIVQKRQSPGGPPVIKRNIDALRVAFEQGYLKAFRDTVLSPEKFDGANAEDLVLRARELAIYAFPDA